MKARRGKPFVELAAIALQEDYRFPILELFAFFFALGVFLFGRFAQAASTAEAAVNFVSMSTGTPLLIFLVVVWKNLAYGLGKDIESAVLQTYFSYPLSRARVFAARVLLSLGVAFVLFLSAQLVALYVLAPHLLAEQLSVLLLAYAAELGPALFLTALTLLLTLLIKRGGPSLIAGILAWFATSAVTGVLGFLAYATDATDLLRVLSVLSPMNAVMSYYRSALFLGASVWEPSFVEVLGALAANYALSLALFALAFWWFTRRLEV